MRKFTITIVFFQFLLCISTVCQAQTRKPQIETGKRIFQQSCLNCHNDKAAMAPSFENVRQIRGKEWVYKFMHNPAGFASSNIEAKKLIQKWKIIMPAFPGLTKADIDAICNYVDSLPSSSKSKTTKSKI